jgi:hypothetical protein
LTVSSSALTRDFTKYSKQVQSIIDKVKEWSDWAANKVLEAWRAFVKLMKKVWRKVNDAWDNIVWPGDYSDAADAWSETVSDKVSGISANADSNNTDVDRYWEGDGANAYIDSLDNQQVAMKKVKSYCGTISAAFRAMSTAQLIFNAAFILAIATFLGGLLVAVFAVETVLGSIAALAGAALLIIAEIGAADAHFKGTASDHAGTLKDDVLADWDAFPSKRWPAGVRY